jgi:hypothetical protein
MPGIVDLLSKYWSIGQVELKGVTHPVLIHEAISR